MIGETAYERKHGGRRLGVIVGQRTTGDAEGRPVEQWEIRSSRGVKFFMAKTDVRLVHEPEPEPEPEPPPAVAAAAMAGAAKAPEGTTRPQVGRSSSAGPAVITLAGIALLAIGIVLLATGLGARISPNHRYAVALAPLLLGLIVILVGTSLIGERPGRPARRRPKLDPEASTRTPKETQ
jgi:hypothetical protein